MVNKYANPETVLGFAYRVSPYCSPRRAPIARARRSLGLYARARGYATVSARNKFDYLVCTLSPI